ncbi:terpene synthase family protein [Pseudomonas pergaminensis]
MNINPASLTPLLEVVEVANVPAHTGVHQLELQYPKAWFAPREQVARAEEIEEQTIEWMRDLGLLQDSAQTAVVRAMLPRVYGGCPGSTLGYDAALLFTQYLTMWLLWDDEVAESTTDIAALEADFNAMAGAENAVPDTPYRTAWRQIGDGIECMGGSIALRQRWVKAMREYASYAIAEVRVRNSASSDNRTFEEAFYMRTMSIGAKPCIVYLEACSGIELGEEITARHEYQQLAWRSAVLQGLQNDLASIHKDFLKNEIETNMVLRYQRDSGCSVMNACRAILDIHDDSIEVFDELTEKLLEQVEGNVKQRLQAYFDYVRYMETGFGFYHTRADRYLRQAAVTQGKLLRFTLTRR